MRDRSRRRGLLVGALVGLPLGWAAAQGRLIRDRQTASLSAAEVAPTDDPAGCDYSPCEAPWGAGPGDDVPIPN